MSLFRMCCATKRVPSIVFSTSRNVGFSNVGLMPSTTQHDGLRSPFPAGLNSSSSPPGNGKAGNGGSPKQGPTPPDAATSNLDGITMERKNHSNGKKLFWIYLEFAFFFIFSLFSNSKKCIVCSYLAARSRWCYNRV